MAISRPGCALVVGSRTTGVEPHSIAVINGLEEGSGVDLAMAEAVAVRDELNRLITSARNHEG